MAVAGFDRPDGPGRDGDTRADGRHHHGRLVGQFHVLPGEHGDWATYTLTVQVTDVAGNTNSLQETFTRVANELTENLIPPAVTLKLTETTARVGYTVTFSIPTQTLRWPAAGE